MSRERFARFALLFTVALVAGCQAAAPASSAKVPAMNSPAPSAASSHRFEDDVAFLSRHAAVKVLTSNGGGRIAISGQYQARVMTSAVEANGQSLGFINRAFIEAGHTGTPFDNYGGEDRFWLGPEGGQYGLYFPSAKPFTFDNWQTPHALQEGAWQTLRETESSISYGHSFSVSNYQQQPFQVAIERTVTLLSREQASERLGLPLPASLTWVGYATENRLSNAGSSAWSEQRGLLSIWILGMFAPVAGTQVVIPFEPSAAGELVNDRYFGKVPSERLLVNEAKGFLAFRADGQYRGKIGLGPARAKGVLGSYSEPQRLLTLVLYTKQRGATRFVNSMWEQQIEPYAGDEINSYNDGPPAPGKPPLGGFYEIESSSPAAALGPGESITHVHQTYHFSGPRAELDALARHVLGVSLDDLP
ncbi:MAG: DUF6786 family protein [Polyangiaceae bacterium]